MTVEIKVGPPQLAVHQGFSVFISEPDGGVTFPTEKGFYYKDTRLINAYAIYANGVAWDLLNSGAPTFYGCRIYLTNKEFPVGKENAPQRSLSLVVSRVIDGGMIERHEITNHGRVAVAFNHEVSIRTDFADIFEVRAARIVRRGEICSDWLPDAHTLTTTYENQGFKRGIRVRPETAGRVSWANGRLSFAVSLAPGESWTGTLRYDVLDGDAVVAAPSECVLGAGSAQARDLVAWREGLLTVSSSVDAFERMYEQAVEDMAALRLPVENGEAFVVAAGLPWFVALFGRDTLITCLQTAILHPEFSSGTLQVLGQWQAHQRDDFRDAEPGKIMHELRQGELAFLKLIPHTPYYGTADATPLFLMALHSAWRASGDAGLLAKHGAVVDGCLSWIDEYGDRDGDGFQEYGTRSGQGYENVGWKDSGNAVVDARGGMVTGPKALCELQGYVYAAWRGMAEMFRATGDAARADALDGKAASLFTHFNAVFWDEAEGFYAYCLDGHKKPIFSVASNPGHLLWCGIVPQDRAERVAARFMKPDMWSGWGIRTLSADNPAYNPFDYQVGAVWPHDNSLIALGFKRYGLHAAANAVAEDIHRAAGFFTQRQLPEVYSGVQRDETNFPVQYVGANVPQAWAAGSVFALVQAILGIELDAPRGRVVVDPVLPAWLPDLTLRGLRMGSGVFDIAFRREGEATVFEVLRGDAGAVVRREALAA